MKSTIPMRHALGDLDFTPMQEERAKRRDANLCESNRFG
jgi:hypothetical protein